MKAARMMRRVSIRTQAGRFERHNRVILGCGKFQVQPFNDSRNPGNFGGAINLTNLLQPSQKLKYLAAIVRITSTLLLPVHH